MALGKLQTLAASFGDPRPGATLLPRLSPGLQLHSAQALGEPKDFQSSYRAISRRILKASLQVSKDQASQIPKVNAQLSASKFATGRIRRGGPAQQLAVHHQ